MIDKKRYSAHRLAWFYMHNEWPIEEIDHINHDTLDNRIENLRSASRDQNAKNRTMQRKNTSGCTGIFWRKSHARWVAHIRLDGKGIHLGSFKDKFEAICARKSAERRYGYHRNHGS